MDISEMISIKEKHKEGRHFSVPPFFARSALLSLDGFGGAVGSASAAINAGIGVDDVLGIALGNCLNGAVLGASAALDASVSDFVSHE